MGAYQGMATSLARPAFENGANAMAEAGGASSVPFPNPSVASESGVFISMCSGALTNGLGGSVIDDTAARVIRDNLINGAANAVGGVADGLLNRQFTEYPASGPGMSPGAGSGGVTPAPLYSQ